jgi:hypothetical protein
MGSAHHVVSMDNRLPLVAFAAVSALGVALVTGQVNRRAEPAPSSFLAEATAPGSRIPGNAGRAAQSASPAPGAAAWKPTPSAPASVQPAPRAGRQTSHLSVPPKVALPRVPDRPKPRSSRVVKATRAEPAPRLGSPAADTSDQTVSRPGVAAAPPVADDPEVAAAPTSGPEVEVAEAAAPSPVEVLENLAEPGVFEPPAPDAPGVVDSDRGEETIAPPVEPENATGAGWVGRLPRS